MNEEFRKNYQGKINIDEFIEMRKKGMSNAKIAIRLDIYPGHLDYLVKELDLPRLKRKGRLREAVKSESIFKPPKLLEPLPTIDLVVDVPCFICECVAVHCVRDCESLGEFLMNGIIGEGKY
ncbi:hypothetical protein ES702_04113 [subsurface metagenome]